MKIVLLIIFLVYTILYLYLSRDKFFLNPSVLFVMCNTIMFSGSLYLIDTNILPDLINAYILVATQLIFITTDVILNLIRKNNVVLKNRYNEGSIELDKGRFFSLSISCLLVFSFLISIIYYQKIGYNLFLLALKTFINGGLIDDFSSYRLAAYSGDNYYAPGYVNQFKNTIFPLINLYFLASYVLYRRRKNLIRILIITPIALLFLLGTGQRGAFVYMTLIYGHLFLLITPKKRRKKIIIYIFVVAILIFILVSIFLGRGVNSLSEINIRYLLMALPKRVFYDNQVTAVYGFRYIYYYKDIVCGTDWLTTFANILPGKGSILIDNEIHKYIYGTMRGTAPLSLWGSVYYNFGFIGVIIFPSILAFFSTSVFSWFIRSKKTIFRCVCYSGLYVIFGTWIAGGPISRINIGLITILIMYFIAKKVPKILKKICKSNRVKCNNTDCYSKILKNANYNFRS